MACCTRLSILLALLVLAPLAACGTAEEPVPAPAEEPAAPAPAPAPAPAEEPMEPVAEEPSQPQRPELVGELRLTGEDFEWGNITPEAAPYTWTARVTNDTTATLDITVRFQFLDDADRVIKTESKVVRLAPAASSTLRESGNMSWDEANRVYSFLAVTDYAVVEG